MKRKKYKYALYYYDKFYDKFTTIEEVYSCIDANYLDLYNCYVKEL